MVMLQRGPMPTVSYDGKTYSLKSRKTIVPDLGAMPRLAALLWICRNTRARGYSKPNPLASLGAVIVIEKVSP